MDHLIGFNLELFLFVFIDEYERMSDDGCPSMSVCEKKYDPHSRLTNPIYSRFHISLNHSFKMKDNKHIFHSAHDSQEI